jgi:hypothetical protein
LSVGLLYIAFIMSRHASVPTFFRAFTKGMWHFVKGFFWLYWEDYIILVFLFLILFICYITFIGLYMLSHPCIAGMNPTWFIPIDVLSIYLVLWIQFANIWWGFLHLCLLKKLCYCFMSCVPIQFWFQSNTGFIEWTWKCLFLFYFVK